MDLERLQTAASETGLVLRGAFHPGPVDGVPALPNGAPARTLVLLGNAGSSLWPCFSASKEYADGALDPLNRWSSRVISALAEHHGAAALFPFGGPPYFPFIAWAKRAGPVEESPLGILIHPDYGLWHAYRGALAFAEALDLPVTDQRPSPCATCIDKPCLGACPVSAFDGKMYHVERCVDHIALPIGENCMTGSCQARRACPIGHAYHYESDHAVFHMEAFLRARLSARSA